jgi:hypothetical protein
MKINLQNTAVGGFNYELLRVMSIQGTHGSELGECLATAKRIHDGDCESWTQEWYLIADQVAREAETALGKGHLVTAHHALLRASSYYRLAEFLASFEDPRHESAWALSRACFQQAIPLLPPLVEVLEIPFEGVKLPGYWISGGAGQRPLLLAMGGYDSSAEEVYHWIGAAAAERGWHCLIFEGPGQRGALHLNPGLLFRPDYEVPVRAVVDYALARPGVDAQRLALIGYSLGGYLAPRAAAFEARIKACIANPLAVDIGDAWLEAWPAPMRDAPSQAFDAAFTGLSHMNPRMRWSYDHARWAMGIQHPHDFFTAWKPYTLKGLEDHLRNPMLFLFGEDEIAQMKHELVMETMQFINKLTCPRSIHLFLRDEGASSHCQMGGMSRAQAVIFDWLEEKLGNEEMQPQKGEAITINQSVEQLNAVLRKYHGEEAVKSLPQLSPFA